VDSILNQNRDCNFGHSTVKNKILHLNSMFLASITEDGVLCVISKLKGRKARGKEKR
jgi:hypothetical protein